MIPVELYHHNLDQHANYRQHLHTQLTRHRLLYYPGTADDDAKVNLDHANSGISAHTVILT